jgi:regulator of sigma E protease
MENILISIGSFALAIGILIAFHEFGHFWTARMLGVRVLRYSIGFGKPLWRHVSQKTGVEYVIAVLPLGGYVKMLDEREGEVPEDQRHLAFNTQPVWKRFLIVFAGPGFNFILAIAAYWLVFMLGVTGLTPMVGAVQPHSLAAQAGLHKGDTILRVGSHPVQTWSQARLRLLDGALAGGYVPLKVESHAGGTRHVKLDLQHAGPDPKQLFSKLGLTPYHQEVDSKIAKVMPGSPAQKAGLKAGDVLVSANGHALQGPAEVVRWTQAHAGDHVRLAVRRHGKVQKIRLHIGHGDNGKGHIGAVIGATGDPWKGLRTQVRYGPGESLVRGADKTVDMTVLTARMLGRMVVGQVSWHNVSGPIQIARYAGDTAQIGVSAFIGFLAIVSISLAILNLLPIPVLDGGHLLYYVVEFFKGSPLSERVQAAGQQVGVALLLMLMTLAFYNDITRLMS